MTDSNEGPGPALRAARQSREIAIREVAEVLNLPIETVEAIEANAYELLPSAVFAKGYIRAYAKLLELDSDPLVAVYPDTPAETVEKELLVRDQIGEFVRAYPQWVIGGVATLGVLLVVLLVLLLWPDADSAPEAEPDTVAALEESALAEAPVVSAPVPAQEAAPTSEPAPSNPLPIDQPVTEESAAANALDVAGGAGRRITPDGDDRLQFEFTEECWVEIKSAAGGNLYSNIGRPGQSLELVGRAPFRILLGYAPGASMAFNDEPVALGPHTRNNVANLVLGQ